MTRSKLSHRSREHLLAADARFVDVVAEVSTLYEFDVQPGATVYQLRILAWPSTKTAAAELAGALFFCAHQRGVELLWGGRRRAAPDLALFEVPALNP